MHPQVVLLNAIFAVAALGVMPAAIAAAAPKPDRNTASAGGQTLPSGAYRMTRADIVDAQGFGRAMTAATMFIPAGWSGQGGVIWQANAPSCGRNGTRFEWTATSPDGLRAVQLLPEETWSGHNLPLPAMQQSCPNVSITTVREFLNWYVRRERPDARILDYRERPEFKESLAALNRQEKTFSGELRSWVEGGEVLIAYQQQGREMRETLALTVMFFLNRMPGVMPGEIREFLTVSTLTGFAVRAPHGQLDFRLAETIRRSIKLDPQWSALMAEHQRKMSGIAAKGAADRHQIRMETNRQISEMNQRSYEDRQASQDRIHERTIQTIRGVDTYVDPGSNERVELPSTHSNVWRLNDGSFLLTDDAGFQPGRDLGVDGRQMEVAR